MIQKLSKSLLKQLSLLKQKKFRDELDLYFVEGDKIINEMLFSNNTIKLIIATDVWIEKNRNICEKYDVFETSSEEFQKISLLKTPNNVIAIAHKEKHEIQFGQLKNKLSLILDHIQDPGNFGTIIRLADWFGIDTIICSEDTVELYNPKVIQSTMGAFLRVKVIHTQLKPFLELARQTKEFPIFGAVLNGTNIYHSQLSSHGIVILGNESKGISSEILSFVNHTISIPNFSNNVSKTESLNVAVATAIICSEFRRKSKKE